jgi:hypothetical protein
MERKGQERQGKAAIGNREKGKGKGKIRGKD